MRTAQGDQGVHLLSRRQHAGAQALGMARDHVQRDGADRAGGAEHGDLLHRLSPSQASCRVRTPAGGEDAVDAVQHAAVAGDQVARVLGADVALEQALEQVADHRKAHAEQRQNYEQRQFR